MAVEKVEAGEELAEAKAEVVSHHPAAVHLGVAEAATGRRSGCRINQDELRRQRTEGHNIEKVTHTNTVMTVYADGGPPMSVHTSSHISNS